MLSDHVHFHSRCLMGIEYLLNSWYLAGRSLDRVEYLPRASIEGLVGGYVKGIVRCSVHSCCYGQECWGLGVLSFVNEVPHYLLQGVNPALNLAVSFMVVLGGQPDMDVKGLHDVGRKLRGKAGVLVKNDT